MATVIIICMIALVIFAVYGTVQRARGRSKSSCCGTSAPPKKKKVADTNESNYPNRYTLNIEGMKCSNCAANVENALNGIDGVWARVDLGKKKALVLTKEPKTNEDFAAALSSTPYTIADFADGQTA